ncbi:hypothetical protein MCAG_03844 [Micromonospora sp. ATCC 39149]|uniref:hypothetical protein n=1 Tax=Micromonospora sp. (strain ATCC 39149 / NRRL 15099 / SCC 1413) TaxID=219305 RepID=UPI0001A50585|nr:hypothetical protein [Micromonospora sp. ATCC 39149]EEP73517.1 hypothetical protein MCAG_03844 [Micromonospora sp. ATCC 39149]
MPDQPPNTAPRQFGRDILVNVLANLVAAAIIYLIAIAASYIKANPGLAALALAFLSSVALFLVGLRLGYFDEDKLIGRRGRPYQPGRGRPAKGANPPPRPR